MPNDPVLQGDMLEILKTYEDDTFDLVFCSPPYEDLRLYGELGYSLTGQDWVDWSVERYKECYRVCKGLVAWVVEGKTRKFRWSATPALLMADLHRAGVRLRKPPAYHRVGIPGSGGPDWLRNDYEFIVCASKGKLPWSDNTACGGPPKYAPGGDMSHRTQNGDRVNAVKQLAKNLEVTNREAAKILGEEFGSATSGTVSGDVQTLRVYIPPEKSNPGNVIHCKVGGGLMGSPLAHENEAPFPEKLAEFFVKSFCPPEGIVLDPFCGSGTTLAVAKRLNRHYQGIDIRQSQVDLATRRLECTTNS
jgi:hypothetical protein